jgi:uncharacterized protein YgbK (DUF1537 family)
MVVIADDLSGAAECAVEFAQPGVPAVLRLTQDPDRSGAQTIVWDLDARDRTPVLSPPMVHSIGQSHRIYLKIDSLLRGNWPQLVAALVHQTARPAILCSALPRLGRGLRDGFVDLESAPSALRRGLVHRADSAVQALTQAGVSAGHCRLPARSDGDIYESLLQAVTRHTVIVVDAHTDSELDAIARAIAVLPFPCTAIGSAGLAGAMARCAASAPPVCNFPVMASMAVLVGSRTGPAREQLQRLAETSCQPVCVWSAHGSGETSRVSDTHPSALQLFATPDDDHVMSAGADLTRRFVADVLARLQTVDCWVATGGETARALCDALEVSQLEVVGQIEPGVSLARMNTRGGPRHLVLKSGSFGDAQTLVRIARLSGVLHSLPNERQ